MKRFLAGLALAIGLAAPSHAQVTDATYRGCDTEAGALSSCWTLVARFLGAPAPGFLSSVIFGAPLHTVTPDPNGPAITWLPGEFFSIGVPAFDIEAPDQLTITSQNAFQTSATALGAGVVFVIHQYFTADAEGAPYRAALTGLVPESGPPQLVTVRLDVTTIPEPATVALLATGLLGLGLARRRYA